MEIQEYISQQMNISDKILDFISTDNKTESDNEFQSLIELLKLINFDKDRDNFQNFLKLLSIISMNHHRSPGFFEKFEKILLHYSTIMKQTFSNDEIFNFFKTSKRILLFLFQKQIIVPNLHIVNFLKKDIDFYPEIKNIQNAFGNEQEKNILKIKQDQIDFDIKRTKGENDGQLYEMIRQDSVEEFITYVNRTNLSLQRTLIAPSIFETNPFLIDKRPTLIEYATFYGSIQIFQYLRLNNVNFEPSLWLYAIHGGNAEIIHFLEEDGIEPPSNNYESCLIESIKCHHNDIAKYILNNKMNENKIEYKNENCFRDNIYYYCFMYHNFSLLPENLDRNFVFLYLCKFGYFNLVKFFLQYKNIDINYIVIIIFFKFNTIYNLLYIF